MKLHLCPDITTALLGMEYVKVILREGRMVGAILIGETDLEVRRVTGMMLFGQQSLTRSPEYLPL